MKSQNYLICVVSLFLIFTFVSCLKEDVKQIDTFSTTTKVNTRSLGNFSIINGRVAFPTLQDYRNTTEYLLNATEQQLVSFSNSLSINTPAKEYASFMQALSGLDDADANTANSILNQFKDKVKIELGEAGDTTILPLYQVYPAITNMNGEYQVEGTVVKQIGSKLVSITDPTLVDPQSLNNDVATKEELGLFVIETKMAAGPICCPNSNKKENHYASGKKLIIKYGLDNVSIVMGTQNLPGTRTVFHELFLGAQGMNQKKTWIFFWKDDPILFFHSFKLDFTANFFSDDLSFHGLKVENDGKVTFSKRFFGDAITFTKTLPALGLCIKNVQQVVTIPNQSLTSFCPN